MVFPYFFKEGNMKTDTIILTFCPSCGSDKITKLRENWTGNFQGRAYSVPSLEFYECPDCGEKIYDRLAMRKIEACSPAFDKELTETKYREEYKAETEAEPV
ncbi:MAG: hypothetical protein DRI57_04485 [Deltaproteobacteria bacterium]|nr:MAG: hypothetical protein DRI57_04485 [Deltaproteobacteria bacterium]